MAELTMIPEVWLLNIQITKNQICLCLLLSKAERKNRWEGKFDKEKGKYDFVFARIANMIFHVGDSCKSRRKRK